MGKKKIQIKIVKIMDNEIEFDLINSEFSFANAIRRIILAEIPVMAIEKIDLYQNTSELPDFLLCQRLALIPIKADPNEFEMIDPNNNDLLLNKDENDKNVIILTLDVECPQDYGKNLSIYSDSIKWKPIGNQKEKFLDTIRPVDLDILLMKLAPSQKIYAELKCLKNIGKNHAKYCPVSLCSYSYLTEFYFKNDNENDEILNNDDLNLLKTYFPPGYLDFDNIDNENGFPSIINNRFNRSDFLKQSLNNKTSSPLPLCDKIIFETKKNILAFKIESIGMIEPTELVLQSINILKMKCLKFINLIKNEINN